MKPAGFRAVVLTAGLGTRLRPLTDLVPKALLPVAGRALVAHTLGQLAAAGCEAAALNLHHLGDRIREALGGAFDGMPLTFSEEKGLLGTLGALGPLAGFLAGAETVVVINGDSLCRWPLKQILKQHRRSGARATLLLSERADPEEFGGGVGLDVEGRVISFRKGDERAERGEIKRRRVFAGCHVLSHELCRGVAAEPADFVDDLYLPLLERGEQLHAYASNRPWFDLGSPRRYLAGVQAWIGGWPRLLRRSWIAPGADIAADAKLRRVVIESGARVEAGAEVAGCLLLPGARVAAGCRVLDSILGFGAALPAETSVEGRLVTPVRANVASGSGDSVVGGLIYTRLDPDLRSPGRGKKASGA